MKNSILLTDFLADLKKDGIDINQLTIVQVSPKKLSKRKLKKFEKNHTFNTKNFA